MPKKAKTGRPTLFKKKFCIEIIEFRSQGYTLPEIAMQWNVGLSTIHSWKSTSDASFRQEFLDAYTRARIAYMAWWAKFLREQMDNPKSNDRLIKYYGDYFMKTVWAEIENCNVIEGFAGSIENRLKVIIERKRNGKMDWNEYKTALETLEKELSITDTRDGVAILRKIEKEKREVKDASK